MQSIRVLHIVPQVLNQRPKRSILGLVGENDAEGVEEVVGERNAEIAE